MKKKAGAIILVAVVIGVFYAFWKFGVFERTADALVSLVSLFSR